MANKFLMELLEKVPRGTSNFNSLSMGIAAFIDDALKTKGMSQMELAEKTGKSNSEISEWLGGQYNFTIETIADIEAALDIQIVKIPIYRDK